ncbi:MAG: acyl-coenzyme A thioesterase PaaI-like protein, partial [Gammaproteobacteria bacterium]
MDIKMDVDALQAFLIEVFPQVHADFQVLDVTPKGVRVKLITVDQHLRPGGTISGPTMFALADVGMYLAILSRIG